MRAELALLLLVTASAACERGPEPKHRHAVPRAKLQTPDTDLALLPQHGVVVHNWGLGGDALIVIDQDASTLHLVDHKNEMTTPPTTETNTRKLDKTQLDEVMRAAVAAWHEDATGPTPDATDVREDLIVLDGVDAFYLSGYPISTSIPEEKTGRPAAARAMAAIYHAAYPGD